MTSPPSPAHRRQQSIALLVAIVLITIWGVNFSLQKFVFNAVTPSGFLFARYLIMPLCAVALLLYRFGKRWPGVSRRDFWALAWLGFTGHFLHVSMVTYGIHWSTPFSSSLILACGPIFTLLILHIMGLEPLRPAQIAGVGIAFAGVLIFLSDKLLGGRWRASGGDLFLLVAASFFSYYTVAAKPLIERHGGVVTMAYATLLGSLPVVLVSLPAASAVAWGEVPALVWAALLWAVIVSAFIGWLSWGWINSVRGVARTAPLLYLMPPVAGLVAWIFIGERYSGIKLAGAGLTLVGVALAQFSRPKLQPAPAPLD